MSTLNDTTDGMVWAEEFCRIFDGRAITSVTHPNDDIDAGTMVGWFANAIETGRSAGARAPVVEVPLREAALWAFEHFEAMDRANAKIHCAPVRYSPLTFRLCRALSDVWPQDEDMTQEMAWVRQHDGLYAEDPGR